MKKRFLLLILLTVLLINPIVVKAKEYQISNTDIKININDSKWYVFTRDNIKDNKELESLGISYDTMKSIMDTGYIYVDSLSKADKSEDMLELFVLKKDSGKIKNLSNYSDKEVKDLAKEMSKQTSATNYNLYKTKYKYIYTKYTDSGKYIIDYYTIINGKTYTIKLQKEKEFTESEEKEYKTIIDNITFNVDESLKESKGFKWNKVLYTALAGGIIGGICGAIKATKYKKTKKEENK